MATARNFLVSGAINGFLTVALGAFAAHGLKNRIEPELLSVFQTGVDYHGLHALALLAAGLMASYVPGRTIRLAGWAFMLGILLFSGSLYLLAVTDTHWLGAITPFGGTAFLFGWVCLAVAAWQSPER